MVILIENRPTVISLFAGCGGSSLGYRLAGFNELLAIDFDNNAVETFKLNFPDVPVWQKDIRTVTGKEIMDFLKIEAGALDVLDGSPPCQGFSTSGKRDVNDQRNDLVSENIRLINELRPKVFVIENVSGMIKGKMKGLFKKYIAEMKASGYSVKCRLMNAKYYGVPQSRARVIFMGVRSDLNKEPSFPEPNHKTISVKEAFKGVDNTHEDKCCLKALSLEIWKKLAHGGFDKFHPKGHWFNQIKVNPSAPSPTITKMVLFLGGSGLIHYEEPRYLTIAELKRLSSFPDGFKFTGKYEEQWARIGNSVPPLLMKAIAAEVKEKILK